MWPFGEENLYECMAETYIPLLNALTELKEEGVPAHITVGITPILAEQLADEHLKTGFVTYLNTHLVAVGKDIQRFSDKTQDIPHAEHLLFLARYYQQHIQKLLNDFTERYNRDVIGAFRQLQDAGCIEITTSGATHGFLPLLGTDESIEAQVKTGVETYKKHFGRAPKGIWLPECAYRSEKLMRDPQTGEMLQRPAVEAFLFEHGLEYFFTEYHAIEGSQPSAFRRDFGVYRSVNYVPSVERPATGLTTFQAYWMKDYPVAVLGRNERTSFQVWSAAHGYPGDGLYREFHKKDTESGMNYWRITSKECDFGDKMLYDPVEAFKKAEDHANHYAWLVKDMLKARYDETGEQSLIMVSFDTELFGHWWFEGVHWLKHVLRQLHEFEELEVQTAGEYLKANPPKTAIDLPESTWGLGGSDWVWNNQHTDWMWPIIHEAEVRMKRLVDQHQNTTDPMKVRLLNQLLRELLLLESSDWPFLVTTFQAKDYAVDRFNAHIDNFHLLADMLASGAIDEARLTELEEVNNPFANVDYRWFRSQVKPDQALQPA